MLPIMNTDLDLTLRKDTKLFVFELCMHIYSYPTSGANFLLSYVALLESYIYESRASVPAILRLEHVAPRYVQHRCHITSDY